MYLHASYPRPYKSISILIIGNEAYFKVSNSHGNFLAVDGCVNRLTKKMMC